MRTIAFLNQKGGTAKSVSCATFARCLAKDHGKLVLVGDADPSGNVTQYMGVECIPGRDMWTLLHFGADRFPPELTPTADPNIFMIPANADLGKADLPDAKLDLLALRDVRTNLEENDQFDYFLLDCHPYLGVLNQAVLLAVDEVIVPLGLDRFSTHGLNELADQVENMRRLNPELRVVGVLPTRYMGTQEEFKTHEWLIDRCPFPVFRIRIRLSKPVMRSVNQDRSLLDLSPKSAAAIDYRRAVAEFLQGVGHG